MNCLEMGFGSFEVVVSEYLTSGKKGHIFIKHVFFRRIFLELLLLGVCLYFGN